MTAASFAFPARRRASARATSASRSWDSSPAATFGDLSLAPGDVVVATRNDRRLGVLNGTRGVVERLDRCGVVVSTPDGLLALPAPYAAAHLAHGYALTIHKAQGATVDRAFVLATDALTREAGYVAMSRARKGTELFVPAPGIDDEFGCVHEPGGADDALVRVVQRLSVSKAKQLALAEYQPALFDAPRRDQPPGGVSAVRARATRGSVADAAHSDAGAIPRSAEPVPDYQVAAIGRAPAFADEREEYERVARVLAKYRDRYGVVGRDPLGQVPMEALRRTRYEEVRRDLAAYERRLGRSRELPGLDLGIGGP